MKSEVRRRASALSAMLSFLLLLLIIAQLDLCCGYYSLSATTNRWQYLAMTAVPANAPLASPLLANTFTSWTTFLEGSGKARIVWDLLRLGLDPTDSDQPSASNVPQLSEKARNRIIHHLNGQSLIPNTVVKESLSNCGTRKLLLRLEDGLEIESVLIPSYKHDRTVSSCHSMAIMHVTLGLYLLRLIDRRFV